jgi:hypothetical protein
MYYYRYLAYGFFIGWGLGWVGYAFIGPPPPGPGGVDPS